MYKFISLIALVVLFKSSLGQTNQYLTINQLEHAIQEDWQYLHEILESKRWVYFETFLSDFDNYPSFRGTESNYDRKEIRYAYKRGIKDLHIRLDNVYSDRLRHIMINTWDEDFYFYLKKQAKDNGYKMVNPEKYDSEDYYITFTANQASYIEGLGSVTVYSIAFHKRYK